MMRRTPRPDSHPRCCPRILPSQRNDCPLIFNTSKRRAVFSRVHFSHASLTVSSTWMKGQIQSRPSMLDAYPGQATPPGRVIELVDDRGALAAFTLISTSQLDSLAAALHGN